MQWSKLTHLIGRRFIPFDAPFLSLALISLEHVSQRSLFGMWKDYKFPCKFVLARVIVWNMLRELQSRSRRVKRLKTEFVCFLCDSGRVVCSQDKIDEYHQVI